MLASYFGFLDSYANNTARGAHREARPHFQPPPSFPGITRSSHVHEPVDADEYEATSGPSHPISQSIYRTGGHRGMNHASPSPSMLLDPQHQPSVSLPRRSNRRLIAQSKLREQPQPTSEYPGEPQHGRAASVPLHPITSSAMIKEDSHLGESWNTTRPAAAGDSDEDGDEEDALGREQGGAGVLGLLYQFQKAQTEGKVAGVSI